MRNIYLKGDSVKKANNENCSSIREKRTSKELERIVFVSIENQQGSKRPRNSNEISKTDSGQTTAETNSTSSASITTSSVDYSLEERPSTPIYEDYGQFVSIDIDKSPHKGYQGLRGFVPKGKDSKFSVININDNQFITDVISPIGLEINKHYLKKTGIDINVSNTSPTEQLIDKSANNAGFNPYERSISTKF